MINVWTKNGKPRLHRNEETELIPKLDIVNIVVAVAGKEIHVSPLATFVTGETK
jgi:hypothetical protein